MSFNSVHIDTAFESIAGVSRNSELASRRADTTRIECSDLEQDVGRAVGYFASLSANHASDRLRASTVGNHGHVRVESAVDAIESFDFFSGSRAAHDYPATFETLHVECVHRLAETVK